MTPGIQTARIDFHRRTLGIRPVKLHDLPGWFWRRVCWASDRPRLWGRNDAWAALHEIGYQHGISILDHVGSSVDESGRSVFVTEPYSDVDDPRVFHDAARFGYLLGVHFRILPSSESWWFPFQTIRIEFAEIPGCNCGCMTQEQMRAASREKKRRHRYAAQR